MLDQLGGVGVVDLVRHPAALAADPAAADVEDLHGGLERVLGERDHVGVGAVAEHDGLLLHRPLSAPRSSRSRAARSNSSASEAACISLLEALDERRRSGRP